MPNGQRDWTAVRARVSQAAKSKCASASAQPALAPATRERVAAAADIDPLTAALHASMTLGVTMPPPPNAFGSRPTSKQRLLRARAEQERREGLRV